jgi:hypothetical protein
MEARMPPRPETVAQLRPVATELALPAGWVAEEIRWDGQDREIAYDPARFQVLRAARDSLDAELCGIFAEHGWRRFGVDTEGAELWVQDRDRTGLARLDRLSRPAAPSLGAEATGPDALYVA